VCEKDPARATGRTQAGVVLAAVKKDFKKIVAEAVRQGWLVKQSKRGGKLKLYAPDGENIVRVSATPSAQNAVDNLLSDLRRYGFIWKGR
jgi:hypothetical protein